jgi:hypothetical protein
MSTDRPYNVEQAAMEFGVAKTTIHLWLHRGDFPHAFKVDPDKLTSAWLIPAEDIEALRQKRNQGTDE